MHWRCACCTSSVNTSGYIDIINVSLTGYYRHALSDEGGLASHRHTHAVRRTAGTTTKWTMPDRFRRHKKLVGITKCWEFYESCFILLLIVCVCVRVSSPWPRFRQESNQYHTSQPSQHTRTSGCCVFLCSNALSSSATRHTLAHGFPHTSTQRSASTHAFLLLIRGHSLCVCGLGFCLSSANIVRSHKPWIRIRARVFVCAKKTESRHVFFFSV